MCSCTNATAMMVSTVLTMMALMRTTRVYRVILSEIRFSAHALRARAARHQRLPAGPACGARLVTANGCEAYRESTRT